jgi:hypothetical protein
MWKSNRENSELKINPIKIIMIIVLILMIILEIYLTVTLGLLGLVIGLIIAFIILLIILVRNKKSKQSNVNAFLEHKNNKE